MNIYDRHRDAVEVWREACRNVELAEHQRDAARQALDNIGQELLASCEDSTKRSKPVIKRGRRADTNKMNGAELKALMREGPIQGYLPK